MKINLPKKSKKKAIYSALLLSSLMLATFQKSNAQYCVTGLGGGGCGSTDQITDVSITGTSLSNLANTCTGTTSNTLTVFPGTGNTTTSLTRGQTYTLNVTSSNNSIISVWIDWDHNLSYDASEWTQVCTTSTGGSVNSISITVPSGAVSGQTGMRIRSRAVNNQNGAADACLSFGSGEAEDYTVSIAAYCFPTNTSSNTTYINDVTIVGTTLNNLATGNAGALNQSYSFYPATANTTAALTKGTTYTINVNCNNSSIISVWIDFDRNNVYDASEWVQLGTAVTAGTATITVPATAAIGTTGMRVRSRSAGNINGSTDACTGFGSGETEDYTVTIGGYCFPTNSSNNSEYITGVTIVGTSLNNTGTINTGTNGSSFTTYGVGPNTTATLVRSNTYTVNVSCNNSSIISVWIDFNRNNDYEASEWVQLGTSTTTGTATITVPASASIGTTGMRVRTRGAGNTNGAIDACSAFGSGETEDYTVTISAPVNITFKVNMSGYIDGGGTLPVIASNIKIAGNFTTNGASIADWNPISSPLFTNTGTNEFSTTIAFPAGGAPIGLEYKFMITQGSWGACADLTGNTQECLPTGTVCGNATSDNRFIMIPATNTTYCNIWNTCYLCSEIGVAENAAAVSGVTVAPNPATNKTVIQYTLTGNESVVVSVYNSLGELVKTLCNETQSSGAHKLEWNTEQCDNGLYTLVVATNNISKTIRLVVAK